MSITEERGNAPIHHFCQRLDVRFVGIASDLVWLTSDVDFYRTLHSRGDNIERCGNVKVPQSLGLQTPLLATDSLAEA